MGPFLARSPAKVRTKALAASDVRRGINPTFSGVGFTSTVVESVLFWGAPSTGPAIFRQSSDNSRSARQKL